jgi:predicted Rossmann-fold nucleotide-binding protein
VGGALSERVAIVGSRDGADLELVAKFIHALHERQPDTVLVSGGAVGVDATAEQEWLSLGGRVLSFRPVKLPDSDDYGVERWELGGPDPKMYRLLDQLTWATYSGACFNRDWLIAENADRLVAFFRRGRSRGTGMTLDRANGLGCPTYVYEPEQG